MTKNKIITAILMMLHAVLFVLGVIIAYDSNIYIGVFGVVWNGIFIVVNLDGYIKQTK